MWHEEVKSTFPRTSRDKAALLAAGAIFAIAALSATGQTLRITLSETPSVLEAGTVWQTDLKVERAGQPVADARPVVVFTDAAGVRHEFAAKPEAKRGVYHVKIQLPDDGRWTYEVRVGDRVYSRGQVAAKRPLPA